MPVDENARCLFRFARQASFLIGFNALPDLFTLDILFETVKDPETNQTSVYSIKEAVDFRGGDTPFLLLRIQQIVHFPELALQPRGFRDHRGLSRVHMNRQRKVSKKQFSNSAQTLFPLRLRKPDTFAQGGH